MEERALLRHPGYAGVLGLLSLIWAAAPANAHITGAHNKHHDIARLRRQVLWLGRPI